MLGREAEDTTVVITKTAITFERKHDDSTRTPYRLVKRAGNDWLLVLAEGDEEHHMTATLAGKRLTIIDEADRVRYVLVRR